MRISHQESILKRIGKGRVGLNASGSRAVQSAAKLVLPRFYTHAGLKLKRHQFHPPIFRAAGFVGIAGNRRE